MIWNLPYAFAGASPPAALLRALGKDVIAFSFVKPNENRRICARGSVVFRFTAASDDQKFLGDGRQAVTGRRKFLLTEVFAEFYAMLKGGLQSSGHEESRNGATQRASAHSYVSYSKTCHLGGPFVADELSDSGSRPRNGSR